MWSLTLSTVLDRMAQPGRENNFSKPPVSFHCISFFVGGARSRVVTMSDVSDNCSFMVSLGMPCCSSTISLRFLFFLSMPVKKHVCHYSCFNFSNSKQYVVTTLNMTTFWYFPSIYKCVYSVIFLKTSISCGLQMVYLELFT